MSRPVTSAFRQAMYAQETGEALITLLALTDENGNVYRFCNNAVDIASNGEDYLAFPFDLIYPESVEGKISVASLTVTNVSRTLIDEIRGLNKPLTVAISAVLASTPDANVATWLGYEWRNLTFNASSISGSLTLESFLNEPYPKSLMGGLNYPGLFFG